MNICMLLAVFISRTTVTETFTSNATWTAPVTTSRIDSLVGSGAAGAAGYDNVTPYYDTYQQETTTYDSPEYGTDSQTEWYFYSKTYGTLSDYSETCGSTYFPPLHRTYRVCRRYEQGVEVDPVPPTTGASSTGFGKTFVGGTGGAATPVTHNNVAVTPGATYSLVVPAGGSITITYTR